MSACKRLRSGEVATLWCRSNNFLFRFFFFDWVKSSIYIDATQRKLKIARYCSKDTLVKKIIFFSFASLGILMFYCLFISMFSL